MHEEDIDVEHLTREIILEWGNVEYLYLPVPGSRESKTMSLNAEKASETLDIGNTLSMIEAIKLTVGWYYTCYTSQNETLDITYKHTDLLHQNLEHFSSILIYHHLNFFLLESFPE